MQGQTLRFPRAATCSALAVLAALGCNGGSNNSTTKKSASTTSAPITSGSTAAPTTSSSTTGSAVSPMVVPPKTATGPTVVSARLEDANANHVVDKGDVLTVTFSAPVKITATDPAGQLELLVPGDSFGKGATLAASTKSSADAVVVLGTDPKIKVTGAFSVTNAGPYASSGIDVASSVAGITDANGKVATPGAGADVASTTLVEGVFVAPGSLRQARGLHTATLLDDGTILVVGGITSTGPGTSAYQQENELYDPLTGTSLNLSGAALGGSGGYMKHVSPTGASFNIGRIAHVAVKLANGKVLIAAGHGYEERNTSNQPIYGALASSFLYDPATHKFTETGKLAKARRDASAALLAGGTKVLIFGGRDANGTMASSEIYDVATGAWTAGPDMKTGRYDCAVVQTPTGTMVMGGATIDAAGTYVNVTQDEVYDPATNAFVVAKNGLAAQRHNHAGALLESGDVLVCGGFGNGKVLTSIERWVSLLGAWVSSGDLKDAREKHVVARIEGDVLAVGGMMLDVNANVKTIDSVETLNASGALAKYPLANGRLSHTVTTLKDGRVLILGGFANATKDIRGIDGTANATIEMFVRP